MDFKNSIEKYKSVYYHFLDGLIGSGGGSNIDLVTTTLKDLTPGVLPKEITFALPNYSYDYSGVKIKLEFYNSETELNKKEVKIDFFIKDKVPTNKSVDFPLEKLKFCIIPLAFNKHQTTTIIFTKAAKMFLYILNTGLDIQVNGDLSKINNEELYQLTKGCEICDDIYDETKLNKSYEIIKNLLFISLFYNFIVVNEYNYTTADRTKKLYPRTFILLKKLKEISEPNIFNEKIFKINNETYNLDGLLENERKLLSGTYYGNNYFKIEKNYYLLASNFIDNIGNEKKIVDIFNIKALNDTVIPELKKETDKLGETFLKKIILYNNNGNIYIYTQESGSCTWFSVYFSILLYFCINSEVNNYLEFINTINKNFYDYLLKIYTKDNFKLNMKNKNDYIYMKQLCSKFIDINLFDNQILHDLHDLIYDIDYDFTPIFNFNINSNLIIFNIKDSDTLPKDNTNIIIKLISQKINNNLDDFLKTLYYISFYIFNNIKDFFKEYINFDSLRCIYNGLLEKYNLSNTANLERHLKIFADTYELKLGDKVPAYITYYIPIILYYNDIYPSKLPLNFEEGKENLFNCCIIFCRLKIILDIIYLSSYLKSKKEDILEDTNFVSSYLKSKNESKNNQFEILCNLMENLININETKNLKDKSKYSKELFESKNIKEDNMEKTYKEKEDNFELFYLYDKNSKELSDIINNKLYENFNDNFDSLINVQKFLMENKKYITVEFLIFNIKRINKEGKEELKNFYLKTIYNTSFEDLDLEEVHYNSLYIILCGLPYNDSLINLTLLTGSYSFYDFKYKIKLLKKNNNTFEDFIKEFEIEKYKLFKDKFSIIPGYVNDNNIITINEKEFKKGMFNNGIFFSDINGEILLMEKNKPEPKQDFLEFYRIIDDNYIKYICTYDKQNISWDPDLLSIYLKCKISKIILNGYEVLKFNDIIYPFKYLLPNTSINYIFKKNGVFNIAFEIMNNSLKDSLLGENKLQNKLLIYEINPNNQFFLNRFSKVSQFSNWNSLCLNYQLNGYNIMYVDLKDLTSNSNGYSCTQKRYPSIFNFDKNRIFVEPIKYELTTFKLLNINKENYLLEFDIDNIQKDRTESYKKLLFKISQCKINQTNKQQWIKKFNEIKEKLGKKITKFTEYIKNINLGILLENYQLLQSYLLNIKIFNFIEKLLDNINEEHKLCSIVKNYNSLFDTKKLSYEYKFEILFELINGNEISKEQMERYKIMVDSYDNYNLIKQQGSGMPNLPPPSDYISNPPKKESLNFDDELKANDESLIDIKMDLEYIEEKKILCEGNYYQLHHFMMGKGKSAIITPLLSLHLNIIKKQDIYIIVPKHLVKQTEATMKDYLDIFKITNIFIKSDEEIKENFLDGMFYKIENTVFLIDEFDSLINPLKSNFNYVLNKSIETENIGNIIKTIITENKDNLFTLTKINIQEDLLNKELFAENLISIIEQLKNKEIKFNIDWGIHSEELFVIPFRSKDKPIKNSSFTSCIKTIFLTYYYYIILTNYKVDNNIFNYINDNYSKFNRLFSIPVEELNLKNVNEVLKKEKIKTQFFDIFFKDITSKIKLPENHYNTSSIDLINIKDIFKIGYSGTVNINLPILENNYRFDEKCKYKDEDESNNIEYAIKKSAIENFDMKDYLNYLEKFDALIDVCGYFYNYPNHFIAEKLNERLKRNIIFIDETDEKMIIKNDGIKEKLNENIVYENPFFYFDQSHTVGIDIKQDNYPILNGLCIVDNSSYYSEVAQAMFRLRKLNLGHTISFVLNEFSIDDPEKLLCKFRYNEDNLLKQQKDNLNLQALKSDMRKKRIFTEEKDQFKNNYKEDLFYYFRDDLSKNPLELIFNEDEISSLKLEKYSLTLDSIRKIIFDLDFKSAGFNIQTQIQTQSQTQIQTQIQTQTLSLQHFTPNEKLDIFKKYKFKDFDFMEKLESEDLTFLNNIVFDIDNLISFLPNIFFGNHVNDISYLDSIFTVHNKQLFYIYVRFPQKFIIIPKFMVPYLYDTFLIYDLSLNIINRNLLKYRNEDKENELYDNKYAKLISNNSTISDLGKIIPELISWQKTDHSTLQGNTLQGNALVIVILYYLSDTNKQSRIENGFNIAINYIEKYLDLNKHDEYIRKIIESDKMDGGNSYKKYLKYKAKYLNLKKILL